MGKDEGHLGNRSESARPSLHRAVNARGERAACTSNDSAPVLCPSSAHPLFWDAVRREWETRLGGREEHSWF